jgi:membrane protease YdiL (CAAX protease family)
MPPTLSGASPWIWSGFVVAATALPIFLGILSARLPWVTSFFRGDRSRWFAFYGTTMAAIWIVFAIALSLAAQGGLSASMVGLHAPEPGPAIAAVTVVLALAGGAWAVCEGVISVAPTANGENLLPHSLGERLFMVFAAAPTAAIGEETIYRGIVLTLLGGAIGPWPANGVQALLFAFHHGGVRQGLPALAMRAVIGFVLGVVVMKTGTLTFAIALHYLMDAGLVLKPPIASETAA